MRKLAILVIISCLSVSVFAKDNLVNIEGILKNIIAPTFPNRIVDILDFGAEGNGVTDTRAAINNAITACSKAHGGTVLIPRGKFFVAGSIILKSNINLQLEAGAEIIFSSRPQDYTPFVLTVWEGTEMFNYSPFIYAYHVTNVAITGKGTINGCAYSSFATWRPQGSQTQNKIRQMGIDQIPVFKRNFGLDSNLPPSMIEFFGCSNVLVDGVRILDAPYWVIHPVFCNNVTVRHVQIFSNNLNNDGCDPEYSRNVLIENNTFTVGDDAVAIKAGRDQDGWRVGQPTENIIIRNCMFTSKCNGLCIGSEMSAGVQNVFMENVKIKSSLSAIYFKSNLDRGGYIQNVWVRKVECDSVRSALVRFETNYHGGRGGYHPTLFQDFLIEDIKCDRSGECGVYAVGIKGHPLKNITFKNIRLRKCQTPYIMENVEKVLFEKVNLGGFRIPEIPVETPDIKLNSY